MKTLVEKVENKINKLDGRTYRKVVEELKNSFNNWEDYFDGVDMFEWYRKMRVPQSKKHFISFVNNLDFNIDNEKDYNVIIKNLKKILKIR